MGHTAKIRYITIRNFALKKNVYDKLVEQARYRGVPVVQLVRQVIEFWTNIRNPLFSERISLRIEKDSQEMGIETEELITKIVTDWYAKYSILELLHCNNSGFAVCQEEIDKSLDRLWEDALMNAGNAEGINKSR